MAGIRTKLLNTGTIAAWGMVATLTVFASGWFANWLGWRLVSAADPLVGLPEYIETATRGAAAILALTFLWRHVGTRLPDDAYGNASRRLLLSACTALGILSTGALALTLNPSACEVYAASAKSCGVSCFVAEAEIVSRCEAALASGAMSRSAARSGDSACGEVTGICEARAEEERRIRRERLESLLTNAVLSGKGDTLCTTEVASSAQALCVALVSIANRGRSTPEERETVRSFLKARGYQRIWGFIVALHEENTYEAAWLRQSYFGPIPTSRHFLLRTTLTNYSSKGRFTVWAKEVDQVNVRLTSGFNDVWKVYEEDAVGSVIEGIFAAPAGEPTQDAARLTLVAMLGL